MCGEHEECILLNDDVFNLMSGTKLKLDWVSVIWSWSNYIYSSGLFSLFLSPSQFVKIFKETDWAEKCCVLKTSLDQTFNAVDFIPVLCPGSLNLLSVSPSFYAVVEHFSEKSSGHTSSQNYLCRCFRKSDQTLKFFRSLCSSVNIFETWNTKTLAVYLLYWATLCQWR